MLGCVSLGFRVTELSASYTNSTHILAEDDDLEKKAWLQWLSSKFMFCGSTNCWDPEIPGLQKVREAEEGVSTHYLELNVAASNVTITIVPAISSTSALRWQALFPAMCKVECFTGPEIWAHAAVDLPCTVLVSSTTGVSALPWRLGRVWRWRVLWGRWGSPGTWDVHLGFSNLCFCGGNRRSRIFKGCLWNSCFRQQRHNPLWGENGKLNLKAWGI